MSELLEIAEMCERATGPDRFLDAQIASVVRLENVPDWARNWTGEWKPTEMGSVVLMEGSGKPGPHFMAREYTASIDAAMTLLPDGWSIGVGDLRGYDPPVWRAHIMDHRPQSLTEAGQAHIWVEGNTTGSMALAIVAAALRARAQL